MAGSDRAARGEPTLEPTPQRLAEARRRGELAVSAPFTAAGASVAAVVALVLAGPALWRAALGFVGGQWRQAASGQAAPAAALRAAVAAAGWALLPVLGAAMLGAMAFGLGQTRGAIVSLRLGWPTAGAGRRGAGEQSLLAGLRALAKVALVVAVSWATLRPLLPTVAGLAGAPAARIAAALGTLAARLGLRLGALLLVMGAADYGVQWLAYRRGLRMTRDEVQRQRRETEGDERHRSRRRQLHRALADGPPPSSSPPAPGTG